ELRAGVDDALEMLEGQGLITAARGRFRLSEAGASNVSDRLGARKLPPQWAQIRDVRMVAVALGAGCEPAVLKAIERPDGLRGMILQKAFSVGGKRVLGSSRLRMALAVVALERAFGNKIKGGLDAGRGLSVKASRLLAGQLARRPRDFGTDTRLIAALAAEAVGATQSDPNSLRQVILRRYVAERLGGPVPVEGDASLAAVTGGSGAANGIWDVPAAGQHAARLVHGAAAPKTAAQGNGRSRPAAASRPDLEGFARTVLAHADAEAEGWPGNRKAFIARVWRAVSQAYPDWGLSEIEFKSMLAETHRTGHVVLGSADIKNKANLKDVQDSAIAYKNTVWHFIRVEN
ncbi:MAG: hypothetical protein KKB37_03890, partial [Alphaproteobacteria bacterium]|nr:hypothetical protein [Alphaproteobacteria bacterium]